jgi:PAS domain S-box-containing protein
MPDAILDPAHYAFSPHAVGTTFVGAAMLALGVGVLVRERASVVGLTFFLVTLAFSVWLLSFSGVYLARDEPTALWWAKWAYVGVPLIPVAMYHFTVVSLRLGGRHRRMVAPVWLGGLLFVALIVGGGVLFDSMFHYDWGYYPRYGWFSLPYLTAFFGMLIVNLIAYLQEYRRAEPGTVHRSRVRGLLIGFGVVYVGAIDYLAKFGIPIYPFGYLPVLAFLVITARTIRRYRLVDITPSFAAQEIIGTMADPLLVCDADQRIRVVNDAMLGLFGYSRAAVLGRPLTDMVCVDPAEAACLNEKLAHGSVRDIEKVFYTATGEPIDVSLSISPLADRDGARAGVVVIARDIRDRVRFRETLEQQVAERTRELELANSRLSEMDTLKSKFVADVSHELRTPITNLKMYLHLLDNGRPEKRERYQAVVRDQADRLGQLVEDILDFSRLERAGKSLARGPVDLNAVAERVVLAHRAAAEATGTRLRFEPDLELPPVIGNADRLVQVVTNLVANAVNYTPGGEVAVHTCWERQSGRVSITVRDTGLGIRPEDLPHVFDRFFRGSGREVAERSGTGLGLSIVKEIVELHAGEITVESEPGRGSTFRVRLPLPVGEVTAIRAETAVA